MNSPDQGHRQLLLAAIERLLAAEEPGAGAGLVLAALDNHAEVVDSLGSAAGNELLLIVADRVREHAPPQALVMPTEGAQFALLLPGASLSATEDAARRLREATSSPVRVCDLELLVTLSLGVAATPVHGTDAGTLLRRAEVALQAASATDGVATYHAVLDQQDLRRQLGAELEQAMAEGQIGVVFQPIIDTRSSDVTAVEALVRWAHPHHGAIPPRILVGLAEETGRIGLVTDHVLELALARCRRWLDQEIAVSVAVNLSGRCLAAPDLVDRVRRALRRHGVPGDLLTLEISEGIVTEHVAGDTVLADLRALGLRLAMDDFGTGFSTLARLRRLPIDAMKIDRSLVSTERAASCIARSIIELGHSLGVRVVAEGVEDELTLERLSSMGCDELQGFALGRPLPDDRLESWVLASTGVRPPTSGSPYRRLFLRG